MPGRATSPRVTVALLAALWVTAGRIDGSEPPGPGCDHGKVSLDMDLPAAALYWDCASSTWPESTQRRPSVDTVYDPEPAKQICMDEPISYKHNIPNSGAYRPIRAASGEYLYCPPQRWLNNLHHGAVVLLYHPCASKHQRQRLSVLVRSCLSDYIITPHLQLSEHLPLALVSWGRTLELSTVASADICDWLETTQTREDKSDGESENRRYNLLLTRPAGQQQPRKTKESLRRCCEQIISSLLTGATAADPESSMKMKRLKLFKEGGRIRQRRAALKNDNEKLTTTTNVSTEDVQNYSITLGPAADSLPGKRIHSNPSNAQEHPQSEIQIVNQGPTRRTTAPLVVSKATLRTHSFRTSQPQKGRMTLQTSPKPAEPRAPDLSAGKDVLDDGENRAQKNPEDGGTDSTKHKDKDFDKHGMKVSDSEEKTFDKDDTAGGKMKENEVVDVKEREVETKETQSDRKSHRQSENTEAESQPDCYCRAGELCGCSRATAAAVNKVLLKTPRTDEAVWAAAALGFLLVLLTLSVLHTRLYRHWRTPPSLYWHDPRQDYDSVADVIRRRLRIAQRRRKIDVIRRRLRIAQRRRKIDVIRRRLRIAQRRRKRGRRQECVLLPSSSSSDEHP